MAHSDSILNNDRLSYNSVFVDRTSNTQIRCKLERPDRVVPQLGLDSGDKDHREMSPELRSIYTCCAQVLLTTRDGAGRQDGSRTAEIFPVSLL